MGKLLKRAYAKGYNLERKVRKELELIYPLVIRSGGSKGPIDLVALSKWGYRVFQVKDSKYISKGERKKLLKLGKKLNRPVYVYLKGKMEVIE